ncbi:MAG: hypothetical protein IT379_37265 [Deltaproteobacteria bacterium]|nr:hypothetical protein [Deltaproteobacteria bacterium]
MSILDRATPLFERGYQAMDRVARNHASRTVVVQAIGRMRAACGRLPHPGRMATDAQLRTYVAGLRQRASLTLHGCIRERDDDVGDTGAVEILWEAFLAFSDCVAPLLAIDANDDTDAVLSHAKWPEGRRLDDDGRCIAQMRGLPGHACGIECRALGCDDGEAAQ